MACKKGTKLYFIYLFIYFFLQEHKGLDNIVSFPHISTILYSLIIYKYACKPIKMLRRGLNVKLKEKMYEKCMSGRYINLMNYRLKFLQK